MEVTAMYLRTLFVLFTAGHLCVAAQAQMLNSGFEIADPDPERWNYFYDPPLYPPLHWDWVDTPGSNKNYVALHSEFKPTPEEGQPEVHWSIPGPVEGSYFVLLSTGDAEGLGSESKTTYSRIEQVITACPGDTLSGYYFFGTTDYSPYNDTGLITLEPVDPNNGARAVVLATISVSDVGSYGATETWQYFQYVFGDQTCGEYVVFCEVLDFRDTRFKSYLALDGFRLCMAGLPPAVDLNLDCAINYQDFDILSRAWLADCNDPNAIADPNIPCQTLVPIRDPNLPEILIDLDFLLPLSEHWLEDYSL